MSLEAASLIVVTTVACILAARLTYSSICAFSVRTPNDVFPFLLKVDMEALNGTFHPEVEEHFRASLSAEDFRKIQWKRIHLAIHYCNMLSNNARVFLGWTKYERGENWKALDPDLQGMVLSLRGACAQCRLASFAIRLRLRWWLVRMTLLPFAEPPTFRTLLRFGSADLISFYQNATALADAFSRVYGESYHQKLVQAL
jgi:hypothetical protein